jgi:hypothetical protein
MEIEEGNAEKDYRRKSSYAPNVKINGGSTASNSFVQKEQ